MLDSAPDLDGWLDRVEALAPQVLAAQAEMDRDAQLPRALLENVSAAGLFRLWLPEELGGFNVDPPSR
jgi:alkylation response protein AidB-like acyl-CoA dehydrogenase